MTEFNMQAVDLKYIMNALRPAVLKTDHKKAHQYIKFVGCEGKITAYAVDGYRAHCVSAPMDIVDGETEFCFLIKPFVLPKTESPHICCRLDADRVQFDFGERIFIEKCYAAANEFIDVEKSIPKSKPVAVIGFQARYLVDALKHFPSQYNNPVQIEIYGELEPVIIRNSLNPDDFRLALPCRLKRKA